MTTTVRNGIITGLGKALPRRKVSNDDLSNWVDTSDEWIRSHTGIESRYLASEGESCSTLGIEAARQALERSGVHKNDIGMVIVATSTPDYKAFPSTACLIQEALDIPGAGAFDLAAACSGFSYAIETARSFIHAGTCDHIIVVGAEVLSSIVNWKDRNTCVLFGDGAGAVVISVSDEEGRGIQFSRLLSEGSGWDALIVKTGGSKNPLTPEIMADLKNPQDLYIAMDGRRVYEFAVRVICQTITDLLERAGIDKEELDWIVPHQANLRIIQAASKRLKIPMEKFFINLQNYGNTSAATVPLALSDMADQGLLKTNHKIVSVGFGAGLSYGGNYLVW
ncbi:ketoacyl-ACP synthase III [Oceanispirochaeta crateris]|uniref:Beta-ketoacyl-[acyl-carrier-protein] synthase III n=1 Tax=Oceanispirochaeta crateris TaxID=2518645 RepID=A0A5C1QL36_9SPIO|nr:beta-ketoacyl-ACP synthase III [Oceanispirochaeta crateris]QEN08875.1 ketoacyl-ACP synthase III [Oceanispirochaeta crateris]